MADYIKREDVISILTDQSRLYKFSRRHQKGYAIDFVMNRILEELHPADVRENVRGEWHERKDIYPHKPDGEMTSWGYKCSRCNQLSQLKYNFCFNCGADMRGGEKDD